METNLRTRASKYRGAAVIPSAGMGTRMGSPAIGKEMLPDPVTGERIIDWPIKLALGHNLLPIVIISRTKTALKQYLKVKYPSIQLIEITPSGEWPETVLSTANYWHPSCNVLLLPDTRFNVETLTELLKQETLVSFAVHEIEAASKYGIVKRFEEYTFTAEKPGSKEAGRTAWGVIKWASVQAGITLFNAYKTRGYWIKLLTSQTGIVNLKWFVDITRHGEVKVWR